MPKQDRLFCRKCDEGWEILPSEVYCGFCGEVLVSFDCELKGDPLYIDQGGRQKRLLEIRNTGERSLRFRGLDAPEWIAIGKGKKWAAVTIPRDGTGTVPLEIDVQQARVESRNGVVKEVLLNAEGAPGPHPFEIKVLPEPVVNLTHSDIVIKRRAGEGEATMEIGLRVQEGAICISEIALSGKGEGPEGWIAFSGFDGLGRLYNAGDTIPPVQATVKCADLEFGKFYQGEISFALRGRDKPIIKTFRAKWIVPPELSFGSSLERHTDTIEVLEDRDETYSLVLRNVGEGKLRVPKIEPKSGAVIRTSPMPEPLEKDSTTSVQFVISGPAMRKGKHSIPIVFSTPDCIEKTRTFTLTVEVKPLELYDDYVAIDFGTTNACCAYRDPATRRPGLIPLDYRTSDPDTGRPTDPIYDIPSDIVYFSKDGGIKYEIGNSARTIQAGRRNVDFFRSVKRRLGGIDEESMYRLSSRAKPMVYRPREVARDIIKRLVENCEKHLKRKVENCVICHPAKFSVRQIDDLKWIAKAIGLNLKRLRLIDEASAAALYYIDRHNREITKRLSRPERYTYTLIVYDFGGGTIDITLVRVTLDYSSKDEAWHASLETLDVDGERWFGGDNVTEAVAHLAFDKLRKKLYEEKKKNVDFEDLEKDKPLFIERAEDAKIALSEAPRAHYIFSATLFSPIKDVEPEIQRDELDEKIRATIERTIHKIQGMLKNHALTLGSNDLIILAGRSSVLPIVGQAVRQAFGKTECTIRLDRDMAKESVALGAYRFISREQLPGDSTFDLGDFANKTHTKIGYLRLGEFGDEYFQEVIGRGLKIPDQAVGEVKETLKPDLKLVVLENYGTALDYPNDEIEDVYVHVFEEIEEGTSEEQLRQGKILMRMPDDATIEVVAKLGDWEIPFTCKKPMGY